MSSWECGKLFCIYQSETEKQRFYKQFDDINLSFCYIESHPVIVLCDSFSKYVMVKLLKNKSQKQLVLFFGPLLQAFPWSILVSDSELALCGPDLAFQFQKFHVHHITSVSYFPASSGLVEKYIHILKVKVSKFRLSELSLPMSVKAAANAMNHFASSKRQISAVQLFFTAYDKKIDYLPSKETAVPHKKIYFLPNGKLFSIYLERIFIAKLGSRVNVILHEHVKYYVSSDYYHFSYHKNNSDEVFKDISKLFTI